jgi:hypothetical protein
MNGPRFHPDDVVTYAGSAGFVGGHAPSGRYVIAAVLPKDGSGTFQYRLRPVEPGPLRVATEAELTR